MKRLFIFRHGKSDWHADYDEDHDRPLSRRGRKAAALIGRFLSQVGQPPQLTIASSAIRALDTARLASEAGAWTGALEIEPRLYGASAAAVLQLIRQQPDEILSLLLAGHEPTCSELVSALIGGGDLNFPTAAIARIDLALESWSQIDEGQGFLVWLVTPKLLQKAGLSP